jgi:RimJ/RimL family protein N-acetyltransferase
MTSLEFRPAAMHDAELLLKWRNDQGTREASHNVETIVLESHRAWLAKTLKNPDRRLLVAILNGVPVGTVRADLDDGVWKLSWTVAPEARGQGIGKRMVAYLADQIEGPIRAEVKAGNDPSGRIAEHAGMTLEKEVDGILHFGRKT